MGIREAIERSGISEMQGTTSEYVHGFVIILHSVALENLAGGWKVSLLPLPPLCYLAYLASHPFQSSPKSGCGPRRRRKEWDLLIQ